MDGQSSNGVWIVIYEWQPTTAPSAPAAQPTAAQMERRQRYALTLCRNAANATSLALANRMVRSWLVCDCGELLADERANQKRTGLADGSDLQVAGKSVQASDKRSLAGQ